MTRMEMNAEPFEKSQSLSKDEFCDKLVSDRSRKRNII
jgi:hypothetical protein